LQTAQFAVFIPGDGRGRVAIARRGPRSDWLARSNRGDGAGDGARRCQICGRAANRRTQYAKLPAAECGGRLAETRTLETRSDEHDGRITAVGRVHIVEGQ